MIDLTQLTPFGRKQWAKKKFDDFEQSRLAKSIEFSEKTYNEPTDEKFEDNIDRCKWKTTVDKKVSYLLARKPVSEGHQDELDALADFIKESAKQYYIRGSLVWVVQGNGKDIDAKPFIMNNTIAVYADEARETPVAFLRKYIDIELQPETGAETKVEYIECYYAGKRDTYCFQFSERDKVGEDINPTFIEIGKTGDAPLFSYACGLIQAFDHTLKHQDTTTEKNTDPLVEVRGYTGTDDADLEYAVNNLKIVKTDGNGGVTVHARSMDSAAIDLWRKAILQEYYEATATVGKDNELQYAQSGKALDRLFVDMDNSAKDLAHILEQGLKSYFEVIGVNDFDIIWNTDRPVDDTDIINGIAASQGILSKKTLLEQHPWVEDVDKELERLSEESVEGFDDLVDDTDLLNNNEEE